MEVQAVKIKSLQIKIALAIVIIRNKPNDMKLEDYMNLLRSNFIESYKRNSDIISSLKTALLDAKIELFILKNKIEPSTLEDVDFTLSNKKSISLINDSINDESLNSLKFEQKIMKKSYEMNIELIKNISKLKSLKKNFQLNCISNEEILGCLVDILSEISYFLFDDSKQDEIKFPLESILHGVQQFLNIFEIEWFYYLRSNLLDFITSFINNLVLNVLKFSKDKKVDKIDELNVLCNLLFILSTSDYLLNIVLASIVKGLNDAIEFILSELANDPGKKMDLSIWNVIDNCKFILDTIIFIVRVRLLNNYSPLSNQVKSNLNNVLNNLFIKLTDVFPEIAINLSKIIQLLALQIE